MTRREKNSSPEPQGSKQRSQPPETLPHDRSQTSKGCSMPRVKQRTNAFDNWKINLTCSRGLRRHKSSSFRQWSMLRDQRRPTEFASWKGEQNRSAMLCCHRGPGGLPRPCVGLSTACGDSGPDSSILTMHVLCVCRKRRPFDLMTESLNVGRDG